MCRVSKNADNNPFLDGSRFDYNDLGKEHVPTGGGKKDKSNFRDHRNNLIYDIQYVQVGWSLTKTYGAGSPNIALTGYALLAGLAGKESYFSGSNIPENARGIQLGEFGANNFSTFDEFTNDLCPNTCSEEKTK